jgi:hypothetical protein
MLVRSAHLANTCTLVAETVVDVPVAASARDSTLHGGPVKMQIGVVCTSTTIDKVTLAFLVEAWDRQSQEFCMAWNITYVPVVLYDTIPQDQVASGEIRIMTIADTIDVQDALGYHTDELGLIFARILAENNAESGPHECCEESLDPDCSVWKPMPDGREIAFESCDPVEGDHYDQDATVGTETRQIQVSNYVLPSYFDPNGQAPFDRMNKLTAPFTMTDGGYQAVRDAAGNESDVFADRKPRVEHGGERGKMAAERKRARPDSRLSRRLAAPKYRSEASSPPMPWGAGPRPEGYVEPQVERAPEPAKPDEPPASIDRAPSFG